MMAFANRADAGRRLSALLKRLRSPQTLVIALPRGGVPVALEVARALEAPLEVLVVRKLGAPLQPELGVGAIAEGGAVYVDARMVKVLGLTQEQLAQVAEREAVELERRARLYRGGRPLPPLGGKTVIVVDDGIATGGSMRAAIRSLRELHPARIVVAAPVIAAPSVRELYPEADEILSLHAPEDFVAVGRWYDDFRQVSDEEVLALLASQPHPAAPKAEPRPVRIPCADGPLDGLLGVPAGARGLVIFAHGSGSSRFSHRNQHVAHALREAGYATLLCDLLTPGEETLDEMSSHWRFDIELLAARVEAAVVWAQSSLEVRGLPIGLFGASTGAAAALAAAAAVPSAVQAVVSRGGRPDLAGQPALVRLQAPVLLIVGGEDTLVLSLNRDAARLITAEHELAVIPGATHLFEEPGALDEVARLAARWFDRHLRAVEAHPWPEGRLP